MVCRQFNMARRYTSAVGAEAMILLYPKMPIAKDECMHECNSHPPCW